MTGKIWAEVTVTEEWWQENKDSLYWRYVERAYQDNPSHGQPIWVMRFGPFDEEAFKELDLLIAILMSEADPLGRHMKIRSAKVTTKPF